MYSLLLITFTVFKSESKTLKILNSYDVIEVPPLSNGPFK